MDAYFCTSAYHLLNAMNIKLSYNKDTEGDCYVFNYFSGANRLVENLAKENIFDNVYLVDKDPEIYCFNHNKVVTNKLTNLMGRAKSKIKNGNYDFLPLESKRYDRSYQAGFVNYLERFYKANPDMVYYVFDDGLSTRTNNTYYTQNLSIVHKVIRLRPYQEKIMGYFQYDFDKISVDYGDKNIKLDFVCSKDKDRFKRIFDIEDRDLIALEKADIIMLTSGMEVYEGAIDNALENAKGEEAFVNSMLDVYSNKDVLIKPHPRAKIRYSDDKEFKGKAPFEAYLALVDISNKTLISPFSTAIFSPYYIFNMYPRIILTYKLLKLNVDKWFSLSEDIINKYIRLMLRGPIEKNRVLIPNNIEEIYEFIEK